MEDLVAKFKSVAANRRGNRYSSVARQLAVEYLEASNSRGLKLTEVARELGIDPNTLRSWKSVVANTRSEARPFVPVVIETMTKPRRLIVRGPAGLLIEGDVDAIAVLIRRLQSPS